MSEILKINNLWGGYQEGVDILRGISMEVQQGEAVGIIGLNGSGKSTFGKAIMNMIPIRRGQIIFEGEDITALTTSQLSHRGISIMQQGGRVFPNLSVWDNLQLAAQAKNPQSAKANSQCPSSTAQSPLPTAHGSVPTAHGSVPNVQGSAPNVQRPKFRDHCSMDNVQWSMLAELVPLLRHSKKELQRKMADKLSGGQKHQLSLAMTLATNPRLVILDEPSAGLSPIAVEEMYQMLHTVRETLGITIILIEQNIAKAVEFCDKNALLGHETIARLPQQASLSNIELLMFKK